MFEKDRVLFCSSRMIGWKIVSKMTLCNVSSETLKLDPKRDSGHSSQHPGYSHVNANMQRPSARCRIEENS